MSGRAERFFLPLRPAEIRPFTCGFAAADPVGETGAVGRSREHQRAQWGWVCSTDSCSPRTGQGCGSGHYLDLHEQSSPGPSVSERQTPSSALVMISWDCSS